MCVVIAANRDEYYDRPALGPRVLHDRPVIWGGRDQQAQGSWLGVNGHGLVVGLTNRRLYDEHRRLYDEHRRLYDEHRRLYDEQVNDDARRSRGLLCSMWQHG